MLGDLYPATAKFRIRDVMVGIQDNNENQDERIWDHRIDLRGQLDKFNQMLDELKVDYEQYFLGLVMIAPDKAHNDLKRFLRRLMKAPFKSSEIAYRLRSLETRYSTLNTYWQRVLKQREDGTYSKDVFKANLRERNAVADAKAETEQGQAEKSFVSLFNSYKEALEKQTGKKQEVNFDGFKKSLIARAKDLKEQHGVKKMSFKVVVKDGKVTVQAKAKE